MQPRDVGKFLNPVFVPDFFLDAAPAAEAAAVRGEPLL